MAIPTPGTQPQLTSHAMAETLQLGAELVGAWHGIDHVVALGFIEDGEATVDTMVVGLDVELARYIFGLAARKPHVVGVVAHGWASAVGTTGRRRARTVAAVDKSGAWYALVSFEDEPTPKVLTEAPIGMMASAMLYTLGVEQCPCPCCGETYNPDPRTCSFCQDQGHNHAADGPGGV